MTTKRKDGGPAFPITDADRRGKTVVRGGMSLRDYFASRAPYTLADVGRFHARQWGSDTYLNSDERRRSLHAVWAQLCYEWADALLAERQKGGA
jgi:allophanate hydrolase subunit 2